MNECQFLKGEMFLVRCDRGASDLEMDVAAEFVEKEIHGLRYRHGQVALCN